MTNEHLYRAFIEGVGEARDADGNLLDAEGNTIQEPQDPQADSDNEEQA